MKKARLPHGRNSYKADEDFNGGLSFREMAQQMDVSYVRTATIFRRAMEKMATHVLRATLQDEPTRDQIGNLATSIEFQQMLAEMMASGTHRINENDPR